MAIVLSLISALAYGTGDYCGGRATRSAPLLVVAMITQTASTGFAIVLVVIDGAPFPSGADVAWSIAAGLMSLLGFLTFYEALARGAMTVVAPSTAVISAVVPVIVGTATGERPSSLAVIGIVLALAGVALVSGVGGRAERPTPPRVALLALVAGVAFGLLFVFLDRTSDDSGYWPLGLGQTTCWLILAATFALRRPAVGQLGRPHVVAAVAGVCNFTANLAYLSATREGLLSLVAVISSMYPATTVALATVIDRERMARSQVVGLGLAVGAVALVGVGG